MGQLKSRTSSRRGAIIVLFAFSLVVIFAFTAFTVDVGYLAKVKTELQSAADAACLAAASELGNGTSAVRAAAKAVALANTADGKPISLTDADIELGIFDLNSKTFTPGGANSNAVRVTARVDNMPLFFAPVIEVNQADVSASAISMLNPRDICFVVDLSGSMNDDTDAAWATGQINSKFASTHPNVGNKIMQDVFTDFGFGTYPGISLWIGQGLAGVPSDANAYYNMTRNGGPLTLASVNAKYRILNSDSLVIRKTKAYSWMIDNQIAAAIPNCVPPASSASYYSYWEKYLDYIIQPQTVSGTVYPPSQDTDRIDGFNNPNITLYPSATVSLPRSYRNRISPVTYVQFMMDWGRDRSPDVTNSSNSASNVGMKTPLSTNSSFCPWHLESTAGGDFRFPPREQPTHAIRRSIIAAIKVVADQNKGLGPNVADRVSIVTFDAIDAHHAPTVHLPLTSDYQAAMQACTTLQAVADINASTSTENGLIKAREHLRSTDRGGQGRNYTTKVMLLLTDGVPNIYQSPDTTINTYMANHPSANFFASSSYNEYNAVLMQAAQFQAEKGVLYPVGVGLGCDYSFMDRIARMSLTADGSGQSPRSSGNPAEYEAKVTEIFTSIIKSPGSRLAR